MKEWVLENTSVTEEQYDEYINSNYKDYPDISKLNISKDKKKQDILAIQRFTLNPTFLNGFKYGIKKKDKFYFKDGIEFQLLSDFYKDKVLFTVDRYGQCEIQSVKLALATPLDILTAICTDFRDVKFLHTFLIGYIGDSKKPVAIDYTMNLVMDLDTYYDLCDVEIIKILSNKDFKDFWNNVVESIKSGAEINLDEFLIFPNEINSAVLKLIH